MDMDLTAKIFNISQNGATAILWVLIILSVISLAMIIERFLSLKSVKSNSRRFRSRMQHVHQTQSFEDLKDLSHDRDSVEGRSLSNALRHLKNNGKNGLEEAFNSFVSMERAFLDKNLSFLATVGSTAPFIGLLGTVLGIMKAFNDLGVSQGNPSIIMVGIAEALVATAVGLFVAIPAVIAYNHFQRQVKSIMQNLDGVRDLCVSHAKSDNIKTNNL